MTTNPTRQLKQLRAEGKHLSDLAGQLDKSREVSLAITKLQEGTMHIGNTLFELGGGEIPYPQSMDTSNSKIDKYHVDPEVEMPEAPLSWNEWNHIQRVKYMRVSLRAAVDRLKEVQLSTEFSSLLDVESYANLFLIEAIGRLTESMNWFGMELNRIHNLTDSK